MAGESHKVSDVLAIRVGDGYIVGSVGCREYDTRPETNNNGHPLSKLRLGGRLGLYLTSGGCPGVRRAHRTVVKGDL